VGLQLERKVRGKKTGCGCAKKTHKGEARGKTLNTGKKKPDDRKGDLQPFLFGGGKSY